jgi:hypothetical protein
MRKYVSLEKKSKIGKEQKGKNKVKNLFKANFFFKFNKNLISLLISFPPFENYLISKILLLKILIIINLT